LNKTIKIASGQGFWGDLPSAPIDQVKAGGIDYLMMDYLAEVTMSIMQKQKMKDSKLGYAPDFIKVVEKILPNLASGEVKIVSNAWGVNPIACAQKIQEIAEESGYSVTIAVVHGDNILPDIDTLLSSEELLHMETGESLSSIKDQLLSANVYFGAAPIAEALSKGANIVVTGRVTDTGLCLAPLIHEFGWSMDDYDLMAAGTIAGHILECGAQSSGGNYTDWKRVGDFTHIGFPVVEVSEDGSFIVTKNDQFDGFVHSSTVKEQLLYEIGDPREYITPDCIADFTSINIQDVGKNRVLVTNIKGKCPTPLYKVSASYLDGFKLTSNLTYFWPDALEKAQVAKDLLLSRAELRNINLNTFHADYIGYSGCSERPVSLINRSDSPEEVQLRFSAVSHSANDLNRLAMEIAPLILTGPSGVTGFAGGRPKVSEIVAYWPALIKKSSVNPKIEFIYSTIK
jgi:hypothetical protein